MGPDGDVATGPAVAGVIARPPLLFAAALMIGFASDRLLALPVAVPGDGGPGHRLVAGALILFGLALVTAGIRNFSNAATPVPTNQPTRTLVTTGIHGWTRNPIYLGMLLCYVGIGLGTRSPWVLLFTLPLAVAIRFGVIAREEAYLQRRFGDAYRGYRARVRCWL